MRQQLQPALRDFLVVEQDEERIEHDHRQRQDARHHAQALGYDGPHLGNRFLDRLDEAVLRHQLLHLIDVEVVMHELLDEPRDIAHRLVRLHVLHNERRHPSALLDYRRNHQHKDTRQHGARHEESAEDGQDAVLHAATVLKELDQREQQVGDEPRQEKRYQYATQPVEQHDDTHHDDGAHDTADKRVECNLFSLHNECKNTIFPAKLTSFNSL